jgi:CelD/BcsL family acetyltransferase involved in cellulose biosynthesis
MIATELSTDLTELSPLHAEWDALATANALPLMAPGWLLAWWRHLAPADAEPRTVVVRDGDELIGIAPFYVQRERRLARVDYRLPGVELGTRLAPLAAPGRTWEVARAVARALTESDPRPDLVALEGFPVAMPWLSALREQWPGRVRPYARLYCLYPSPVVNLSDGSFEQWLAGKSSSLRRNHRRRGRMLAEEGGTLRSSTPQSLAGDVETLLRLHTERWQERGASTLVSMGAKLSSMLVEAGEALSAAGRFRIWLIEIDGEAIWANLFLDAGGELQAVNGGWDERWSHISPPTVGMFGAIADAFEHGDRRLDLGVGASPHKLQFADGDDPVAWGVILPAHSRMALAGLRTAPMLARYALRDSAKRVLTEPQEDRLRKLRHKLHV